ncbi:FeoB-associated Cys-rich membrane protein, partial [Klebsiella pneumoniae]
MFILVNTILFIAIFGYTAMTLVKFFKRSKEGDCGGCKSNCKCDTNTSSHKNKLN